MNDSDGRIRNQPDRAAKPGSHRLKAFSLRHPIRNAALVLFAVILMAVTAWLAYSRHRHYRDLNRIRHEFEELKSQVDILNRVKSRRVEFFRLHSFINSPSRMAFAACSFIRKLGSIDSSRLILSELNLVPGNQNIGFQIKAIVPSMVEAEQAKVAEMFCRELTNWPEVFDVSSARENPVNLPSGFLSLSISGKIELE